MIVGAIIPTIDKTTVTPIGVSYPNSSNVHTFTCNYTTSVTKPTVTAYINIYKDNSLVSLADTLAYRIDSSMAGTTTFFNNISMSFNIPFGVLLPGHYYLTFDYGTY